jgi:AcrR family transcriptional regulator
LSASAAPARTLSTAEQRREDVLLAAMPVFGQRGLYGTPTTEVAKAAGISQAYLFRLYPTKEELFVALLERCFERIHDAFAEAIASVGNSGMHPLEAMGVAYTALIEEQPELLLNQLQGQAASSEPAVREALRRGFAGLFEMVERESGAPAEEIHRFFAHGMLCNLIAALQISELDQHWAQVLAGEKVEVAE